MYLGISKLVLVMNYIRGGCYPKPNDGGVCDEFVID